MKVKVLILSDTHGDINLLKDILKKHRDANYVLHLGDHSFDIKQSMLPKNTILRKVMGNCDFKIEEKELFFMIENKKIFMCHGDKYSVKRSYNNILYKGTELGADIVLFGHTHIPLNEKEENLILFNPGSLNLYRNYSSPSYGIMTIEDDNIDIKHIFVS